MFLWMCFLYLVFYKRSLTDVTPTTAGRDMCCFNLIFLIGYKQPTYVFIVRRTAVDALFEQRDDGGLPIARQRPYIIVFAILLGRVERQTGERPRLQS